MKNRFFTHIARFAQGMQNGILHIYFIFYYIIIFSLKNFNLPKFLGEAERMKPKSICMRCPALSNNMLPLCLKYTLYSTGLLTGIHSSKSFQSNFWLVFKKL